MTARQTAITGIATHRPAKTQDYLESAGADIYGQYVFNDVAQRKYLAKATYQRCAAPSTGTSRSTLPSPTRSRTR